MSTATLQIEKKKTLVPHLRFQEFDGEWKFEKLKDISKIERGRFSPRPRNNPIYYNGEIPFVQTSDVVNANGKIEFYTQTLNKKGLAVSKLFPKGSILITIAANIGHSGVLQIDMACPDSLIGIKPNSNIYNYFLNYYLATRQKKMDYLAPEGAQKNINIEFLNPYRIPITTLPEQQKIASFLIAVDEKIKQLSRKKELLAQYKKGVMQQLFSGKLRFKDENGEDYADWEEKKLGDLGVFKGGGTPSTEISEYWNGDIPWISSSDLIENDISNINVTRFITEKAISESATKLIPVNSVLFISRVGVGKLAVSKRTMCTSQDFANFIPNEIDSFYLAYYFMKNNNLLSNYAQGTSIKGFTSGDLKSIKVSCPVLDEQQKIAKFLSSIDTKIESTSQQINQTQNFKKGLLQQMFV